MKPKPEIVTKLTMMIAIKARVFEFMKSSLTKMDKASLKTKKPPISGRKLAARIGIFFSYSSDEIPASELKTRSMIARLRSSSLV